MTLQLERYIDALEIELGLAYLGFGGNASHGRSIYRFSSDAVMVGQSSGPVSLMC